MDVWEADGRLFEVVTLSDVVRGGMALELTDLGDSLEVRGHGDANAPARDLVGACAAEAVARAAPRRT